MAGCEGADEEEVEEVYLVFGTGAGVSEMMELGTGESGMGADICNVCAHLCHDLKDVGPRGAGAGILCVCCEQCKVWVGVFGFRVDSVEKGD